MDGSVRRNIALKLKDSTAQKTADSKRRKEKESEDTSTDIDRTAGTLQQSSSSTVVVVVGSKKNQSYPSGSILTGQELRWDQKVNLIGRAVKDPLLHLCEICSLPILIYGRMKRCRHAFCRDCAKKAGGVCPKCKEGDQSFEEASMGNVYICTHGGGRYDNKGCGRSYLSQRDLEAHVAYRHKDKAQLAQQAAAAVLQASTGNPMASFPISAFFQPGVGGIPPTGIPPTFTGTIPPPPPPMTHSAMRPHLMAQFAPQGSPSLSTAATAALPANWNRPPMFK